MLDFFFNQKHLHKSHFCLFFGKQNIIAVLHTTFGTRLLCPKPNPFFLAEQPRTSHLTSLSHESGPKSRPYDKALEMSLGVQCHIRLLLSVYLSYISLHSVLSTCHVPSCLRAGACAVPSAWNVLPTPPPSHLQALA